MVAVNLRSKNIRLLGLKKALKRHIYNVNIFICKYKVNSSNYKVLKE